MAQQPLTTLWWTCPETLRTELADAARTAKLVVPRVSDDEACFCGFVETGRQTPTRRMNVRIRFVRTEPDTPKVFAPEFVPSPPHRNPDPGRSLCLWYPHDPIDKRWVRSDGLGELFLMAGLHLRREHFWQLSADDPDDRIWPGPEEGHGHPWSLR